MAEILRFKGPSTAGRHKGATLCRHNHHTWATAKETRFDVKQGQWVTVMRCVRCGLSHVGSS